MTPEDIATEYWAHRFAEKPSLASQEEDEHFDIDKIDEAMANDDWEEVIRGG